MTRKTKSVRPDPIDEGLAILDERSRRMAARGLADEAPRALRKVILCEVSGNLYALPIEDIERIDAFVRYGAAPGGHPAFVGLASIAGRVRPVLDLGALVGSAPPGAGGYLVAPKGGAGATLRVSERPTVADIETLEVEGTRAAVRSQDDYDGRIVSLIAVHDLIASSLSSSPVGA